MPKKSMRRCLGTIALLAPLSQAQAAQAEEASQDPRPAPVAVRDPFAPAMRAWCDAHPTYSTAPADSNEASLRAWCVQYRAVVRQQTHRQLEPTRQWYGKNMIITDLTALGLFLGGAAMLGNSSDLGAGLMVLGAGTYALGGPIVHFSEGQVGRGFASLGLRVVGPVATGLTGAFIGAAASSGCGDDWCGLEGAAIGGLIGFTSAIIAAPIIDNVFFARKKVPPQALAWSVMPSYQPVTGQAGLTLRGNW